MRTKEVLKNLKKTLQQDYLYNSEELKFNERTTKVLEEEIKKKNQRDLVNDR